MAKDDELLLERRLGEAEIAAYARLTGDFNPIHMDEAFAAESAFGKRILHGTLTLTLLWRALAELRAGEDLVGTRISLRFTAPVGVGERAIARLGPGEVRGSLKGSVENEAGQLAVRASLASAESEEP